MEGIISQWAQIADAFCKRHPQPAISLAPDGRLSAKCEPGFYGLDERAGLIVFTARDGAGTKGNGPLIGIYRGMPMKLADSDRDRELASGIVDIGT